MTDDRNRMAENDDFLDGNDEGIVGGSDDEFDEADDEDVEEGEDEEEDLEA